MDDTLTGNSGANRLEGGPGDDLLTGDAGNDTYAFSRQDSEDLGTDTITEGSSGGTDALDFGGYGAGVDVDLSAGSQQVDQALSLTLTDAEKIENVVGSGYDDTIEGNTANNVLAGGDGNDTYVFTGGSQLGSDTVTEGDGGGTDVLDFNQFGSSAGVDVDLTSSAKQVHANLHLILTNPDYVEDVVGTAFNDTITGNGGPNVLEGGVGNDILTGGAGNDTYVFANTTEDLGTDTIVESDNGGSDALDFGGMAEGDSADEGVTIDLGATGTRVVHDDLSLNLPAAELDNVVGSDFDDSVVGNIDPNVLEGGLGDDTLLGGDGNDSYVFGQTDDTDDLGSDVIQEASGEGTDLIDLGGMTQDATSGGGIALDLMQVGSPQAVHEDLSIQLDGAAYFEDVTGSGYDDTIGANAQDNVLTGGDGDDRYVFANTTENLGTDTIVENDDEGSDTLDFDGMAQGSDGVTIDLSVTGSRAVHDDLSLDLPAAELENIVGSDYDDSLVGNADANILEGGQGNDRLDGGDGDDTYVFYGEDDLGSDEITEQSGEGSDTLDFSSFGGTVDADLADADPQTVNATYLTLKIVNSSTVENVTGSANNDTISGTSGANWLAGGGGADSILGLDGDDTLEGDTGDDELAGGDGNDTYYFAGSSDLGIDTLTELTDEGSDTLNFSGFDEAIDIDLGDANPQQVHLSDIDVDLSADDTFENVVGTAGDDTIEGNESDNILSGGEGNDTYVFVRTAAEELGSDTIVEDAEVDTDTLDFSGFNEAIDLNLAAASGQTVHDDLQLAFQLPLTEDQLTAYDLDQQWLLCL